MNNSTNYMSGALFSIGLHTVLVAGLLLGESSDTSRVVIEPQYIKAALVSLAPVKKEVVTTKSQPKDRSIKREQQRQRQAKKDRARELRVKQAEDRRKENLRREKQQQDQIERSRQKALQQELLVADLAEALSKEIAEEDALLQTQKDEAATNSYRQIIQQRLSENWNRPPSARIGMETLIRLQLVPTGRVVGVTILQSSGDAAFDRSVELAAFKVGQIAELQSMSSSLFERKFRQVSVLFSPQDLRL
ncbi:MAG TPA: hypothetical protein DCX08_13675 [Porticoccaceae bacterium]|jgi:colicin import membrane protein|nr:hypothetical protein [Porticoccaceae bacterium]